MKSTTHIYKKNQWFVLNLVLQLKYNTISFFHPTFGQAVFKNVLIQFFHVHVKESQKVSRRAYICILFNISTKIDLKLNIINF